MKITRSIKQPIRRNLNHDELWNDTDNGLIICWEVGRRNGEKNQLLAKQAVRGELPVLGWKGGVDKKLKIKEKYGSQYYLAQWLGLRGDDLSIDTSKEIELTCTKTGMKIIYTNDSSKYSNP